MGGRRSDYVAIIALAFFWGLNWPAVRTALYDIGPWTLRALGMGAGAAFLFGLAALRGQKFWPGRQNLLPILLPGFFTITLFNLLLAFAQLNAPTSRAAIVTFTFPVWTVILAYFVLGETLTKARAIGLLFGLLGLTALGWPLIQHGSFGIGLMLALGAGVGWAVGSVLIKKLPVAGVSPMVITAWQLAGGALVAAIGMVIYEPQTLLQGLDWRHFATGTWVALFHHIVFSQAFAYIIWYNLLARLPAGTVSLATLMVPAIGVMGSMLFLAERPTLPDFLGLIFMTLAAAAVMRPAPKPATQR